MATIKSVALRAGVSVGTVSNVINGKTNNAELIERVENAIAELGFRPDGKARSLKSTQTYLIGVLVSSLQESGIQTAISAIERTVQKKGYSVLVKITDNNAILERKYIESFAQMRIDGIIVDTGVEDKKWLSDSELGNIPIVFMEQRPVIRQEMNLVCIDYEQGLGQFLKWCSEQNKRHVGMILRDGMMEEGRLENHCKDAGLKVSLRIAGHNAPGDGFKAAYEIFYENEKGAGIDMILAGSQELAKGVFQAADILGYREDTRFACIKSENWIEDSQLYDCILDVSFMELGRLAAEKLLGRMGQKDRGRMELETMHARFKLCDERRKWPGRQKAAGEPRLKAAILNSGTASVLKMVSEAYQRKTGVKVQFQSLSYHDLWHLVRDRERLEKEQMDVIMYDMVWKEPLVREGRLARLGGIPGREEGYFQEYIDHVVRAYGICDGGLYGLPFLTGTQMLFCQKDLFEDATLKRQFQQRYGYSLECPGTWEEFLDVAEFFTQESNPKSPVKYGTSLINTGNLYNSIEFLNFLWALGDDIIVENRLNLDSPLFRIALEKYKRAYRYTSGERCGSWEDIAGEFKTGRVAMVILYDSYAFGINDPMESRVAGNVESAVIPGKSPVLGGWGLGCLESSENFLLAREFVRWVCGPECDNLFSVLSGISNRKRFYMNRDLDGLYPWKKDVLESYSISRQRNRMELLGQPDRNMEFYDEILGRNLCRMMKGEVSIDEGISEIKRLGL